LRKALYLNATPRGKRESERLGRFGCDEAGQSPSVTNEPVADDDARLVRITPGGPLMIQGPVRIEMPDGTSVESDRFMVAICTCKRSKTYPLCDTSHRKRRRDDQSSVEGST
jgi:CDGSH-type Zn-finger protein